jgi:uncharacterized membrane protein YgdD (TMEM256/DUF423 family)
MQNHWICVGAANAFLAVAAGAFGAHGLRSVIPADRLAIWETAAHYHLVHALALVLVGALRDKIAAGSLSWVGRLFLGGIVLFSGSLYALSLSGVKVLGAITPLGGVCFLLAWTILAVSSCKHPPAAN